MGFLISLSVGLFVAILSMPGTQGQTSSTSNLCATVVATLDCSLDPPRNICASNGVTYPTSCEFAKAHCLDLDIHFRYYGACAASDQPDPICGQLLQITCPTNNNPVCASDGITYPDFCRYEQAHCRTPEINLISLGACPTTPPPTTASLFDVICQVILSQACQTGLPQVCGSDGVTYDSACALEQAQCQSTNNDILFVKEGAC